MRPDQAQNHPMAHRAGLPNLLHRRAPVAGRVPAMRHRPAADRTRRPRRRGLRTVCRLRRRLQLPPVRPGRQPPQPRTVRLLRPRRPRQRSADWARRRGRPATRTARGSAGSRSFTISGHPVDQGKPEHRTPRPTRDRRPHAHPRAAGRATIQPQPALHPSTPRPHRHLGRAPRGPRAHPRVAGTRTHGQAARARQPSAAVPALVPAPPRTPTGGHSSSPRLRRPRPAAPRQRRPGLPGLAGPTRTDPCRSHPRPHRRLDGRSHQPAPLSDSLLPEMDHEPSSHPRAHRPLHPKARAPGPAR